MKVNTIYNGNSKDVLKTFDDNSIDSIVTDPPYELGFMGKSWDSTGIAYDVELWKQVFRVLKPGGYLLSFGGSRTYHRMACAIEDAGFEIRDMIEWVYGSGFPKSLNIGKAIDKMQGNEREDLGVSPAQRLNSPDNDVYEAGIRGKECRITKGTSDWEGWGTALKPAHEPICMARKPLSEKTVAGNVLKYGTGGINIDASRIEGEKRSPEFKNPNSKGQWGNAEQQKDWDNSQGRFPANLIHDGSDEVLGCFPITESGKAEIGTGTIDCQNNGIYGSGKGGIITSCFADKGSASRFFYCAKTSKAERDEGCLNLDEHDIVTFATSNGTSNKPSSISEGRETKYRNNHPTVKPIALMQYLVKLVTPPGGIVCDPFSGSGSTLISAGINGFSWVGIDLDKDYIRIAKARINGKMGIFGDLHDMK